MKNKNNDFITLIIIVGCGALTFLISSLMLSAIVSGLDNPIKFISATALASAAIAGLSCGLFCQKITGQKLLGLSLLSGGIIAVLILALSLLIGRGGNNLMRFGVPLLLFLCSGIPALIPKKKAGVTEAKRRVKRIQKRRI